MSSEVQGLLLKTPEDLVEEDQVVSLAAAHNAHNLCVGTGFDARSAGPLL